MKTILFLLISFIATSRCISQNDSQDTLKFKNCDYKIYYYPTGTKKEEGCVLNGKKEGYWYEYYENTSYIYKSHFKAGIKEGTCYIFYKSGKLREIVNYKDDTPSGTSMIFKENGDTIAKFSIKRISYKQSTIVWRKYYDPNAKEDGVMETIDNKRYMWMLGERKEL